MRSARRVASVFFPLDVELGLAAGSAFTPRVLERMARLGAWLPFRPAAALLQTFCGVNVSEATLRTTTHATGKASIAWEETQVAELVATPSDAPQGAPRQVMSVDGAFVPVVGGQWKEVKTLTLGVIQPPVSENGHPRVHTTSLSYFSRCADATTFARASLAEVHRRGVERADVVCAVSDGAAWIADFVAYHRADAVRILDFWHAAEHVATAGKVVFGAETAAFTAWFATQRQHLQTGDPRLVVTEIGRWATTAPTSDGQTAMHACYEYLHSRQAMIEYATFAAQGYPIGSGSAESANKVVVEARLKGAGMHWAEAHLDGMLALRTGVCNDRWAETWTHALQQHRTTHQSHAAARCALRRASKPPSPSLFRLSRHRFIRGGVLFCAASPQNLNAHPLTKR